MSIDKSGYSPPDLDAPLDVEAHHRMVPEGATIKGMFIDDMLKQVQRRGLPPPSERRFIGFKDYPLCDFIDVGVSCARALHPRHSERRSLFELGRNAFPLFRETMVGRAMFAMAGSDPAAIVRLTERAYRSTTNFGKVRLLEVEDGASLTHYKDMPNFVDSYHVGIAQGVLDAVGVQGGARIRTISASEIYLLLEW
jgi:uncharacterized protein (TIGR02265 family)